MEYRLLYGVIATLLVLFELVYFRLADHFNIIDKPNQRSSHKRVTLRGGGIIFPISMLIQAVFFGVSYLWFLVGLISICTISFIDDIRSVSNSIRLAIQFVSILLLFYQWGILVSDSWWIVIVSVIFCTGIINAYNFMDGINGITGGYSLIVLLSLAIVNARMPFVEQSLIISAILGVLVFCFFNFRTKAKCFAGDVGSIGISFIIIFLLGQLIIQTGDLWYIVFLSVYGVDSILTIIHRIILKENIGQAHRKHAYQLMANELHISHVRVSAIYMIIQAVVSAGIIWLPINGWLYLSIVLAVLCVTYALFITKYYHLHTEYLKTLKQS
ncbi:glycosyltransferase family 4 protein [Alistipes sp. D31t1_170403_E11]|uniref:MraY family glycosyltransferase n=1 Tax=Alistipes sp. D31t1_170403_E11 TaxID=2787128 RepID=UPI001898DB71|nr:glycosyltransferase family 4 protein [Alistipes sp. D31t1_170403_E11]